MHEELAKGEEVPPALRSELEVALRDVERALGHRDAPLSERMEALAARVEAEHPAFAESVRALVQALAGIGI
jgi:hypothetical protein